MKDGFCKVTGLEMPDIMIYPVEQFCHFGGLQDLSQCINAMHFINSPQQSPYHLLGIPAA